MTPHQEALQLANSLPLWIFCILVIGLIFVQTIGFLLLGRKYMQEVNITKTDINRSVKSGLISTLGPALSIFVVGMGLISQIGAPITISRLSVIGNATYEASAAEMAAVAMNTSISLDSYSKTAFAASVWVMNLGGICMVLPTLIFLKPLSKLTDTARKTTRAGMVCITPPELMHQQKNLTADCETYYAVMQVNGRRFRTDLRTIDVSDDPLIGRWFQDLVILNRESDKDTATAITQTILSRILHCESANNLLQELPRGVQTALHYIEEHYHLPLTIGEITQAACLSQSYLNALFRRITGMGTRQYLEYYRMRIARQLLQDPNFSIAEVAYHCGFSDPHYFSRRFQDFHQQSPSEFRRNPTQAGDFADMRNSLVKSDCFRNL